MSNYTLTKSSNPVKLYATNSTSASITAPSPTTTEPSGSGVFDLKSAGPGHQVPNLAELIFFGAGSNNGAGTAKVYLWFQIGDLWIPYCVASLDITLGTTVGVASQSVIDTDRFADTLAATAASVNSSSLDLLSPVDNLVARAIVDLVGASKIEVRTAKGTATNLNALLRGF